MRLTKNRLWCYVLCCLLIASVAISATVFLQLGPLVVAKAEVSINKTGERVYHNKIFSGEMRTYHANGQLASAEQFLNGRRQGYSKKWFADGLLGFESNFVSGLREGATRSWWYNGMTRSETFYVAGKSEGVAWHWYRSGAKFKRFNFVAGKSSGLQQGWRENGKLFTNFEYKNGRIYGLRKANSCVGLEDENISADYVKSQDY